MNKIAAIFYYYLRSCVHVDNKTFYVIGVSRVAGGGKIGDYQCRALPSSVTNNIECGTAICLCHNPLWLPGKLIGESCIVVEIHCFLRGDWVVHLAPAKDRIKWQYTLEQA